MFTLVLLLLDVLILHLDFVIYIESEYALLPVRYLFNRDINILFSTSGELDIPFYREDLFAVSLNVLSDALRLIVFFAAANISVVIGLLVVTPSQLQI